jgi:hypothetical protein
MGVSAWALVISIFAAVLALTSLAWQIVWQIRSWKHSGPVVSIVGTSIGGYDRATGQLGPCQIGVSLNNTGRASVEVVGAWVVRKKNGETVAHVPIFGDLQLPRTLEAQHQLTIEGKPLAPEILWADDEQIIEVNLGNGKKVSTPLPPATLPLGINFGH